MPAQFEIFEDSAGKNHFRLRDSDDKIVAVGEAYETREACIKAIQIVQQNCHASTEDLTKENPSDLANPKYQIYRGAQGEYRFHLTDAEGKIIIQGTGHVKKDENLNALKIVRASDTTKILESRPKKPSKKTPIATEAPHMAEPEAQTTNPAKNAALKAETKEKEPKKTEVGNPRTGETQKSGKAKRNCCSPRSPMGADRNRKRDTIHFEG